MKVITKEDFKKAAKLDKLHLPGLASLLMEVMKINEVNEVFQKAEHLQGPTFIDKILQIIGITVEFDESELKNIPKEGPFIAIANHPYGGIEGLVLLKLLCTVRPDAKLMANFLLKKIPNLSDYFIAVNPFENIEHSSSISGIKNTLEQLRSGIPIGIFPAGEVSTFKFETQHMKVPVLLRQYLALNARIICFNIDPKFSDSLDGFLVVDMEKIPEEMLEKIGKNL